MTSALSPVERSAVAEEIASLVRHDLRNKLASIRHAAAYLARKAAGTEIWSTDPRFPRFFQLIQEEVDAADRLLGERLAFQHLFSRHAAPTRLGDAVRTVLAEVSLPERIIVSTDVRDDGLVHGDRLELMLMFRCLLDNAAEALAGQGQVKVTTRDEPGAVLLTVSDSGEGLPAEPQPFRSTKPGHLGVGLAIARRTARRYGGDLVTAGGCVAVRLPRI